MSRGKWSPLQSREPLSHQGSRDRDLGRSLGYRRPYFLLAHHTWQAGGRGSPAHPETPPLTQLNQSDAQFQPFSPSVIEVEGQRRTGPMGLGLLEFRSGPQTPGDLRVNPRSIWTWLL